VVYDFGVSPDLGDAVRASHFRDLPPEVLDELFDGAGRSKIAAVISAIDALRHPRLSPGMSTVRPEIASGVQHALMWESPLVDDPAVQRRMRACSEAARILSWNDPRLAKEGTDRGAASLRLQRLATSTRATLEAYLTEQPLPEWSDLPEQAGAFAWVVRPLSADG
jgi:hypothetical protein